ncbi:MAG: T9SS type A sorting domain-containing protein [Flavobacteriales bacterium]
MKKLFSALLATASILSLQAQTTALDFTADDCDHVSHNLFSELDAGNAVILEFVMMGCQPCVTACNSLTNDVLPNVSDPSRVKLYSIGFTDGITCLQMNDWKTTNGFTHTVFAGMSAQTTHYGGMGMPTIAVVGGPEHTVFYSDQGHSDSDNPVVLAAIEDALAAGVGITEMNAELVPIHPNPVMNVIELDGSKWTNGRVVDVQGREVLNVTIGSGKLDVSMLNAGLYVVQLSNATGFKGIARFEKK